MSSFTLPMPPSVNNLFATNKTRRHKSERYEAWIMEASYALFQQRPKKIEGQVELYYVFQDGVDNRRRDLGNFEKATTDLLVAHGIIEADDNRIVRKICMRWSKAVSGVFVSIVQQKGDSDDLGTIRPGDKAASALDRGGGING